MTPDILIFLILLGAMILAFLSGRIPYEITALTILFLMYCFGLVPEQNIFSGFSSTAIIVLVMTFFLAAALKKTGLANRLAIRLAKIGGKGVRRNLVVIMSASALVSSIMPNVATVAMLLPAVLKICSINRIPESRILIPFVFAVIIGGLFTLIGTSGSIVAVELQKQNGLPQFSFFEFTPFGLAFAVVGFFFLARYWYRLLPRKTTVKRRELTVDLKSAYHLNEEQFTLHISAKSSLIGQTLKQAKIGELLALRVVAIYNSENRKVFPDPDQVIQAGDRLIVLGSFRAISERLRFNDCTILHDLATEQIKTLGYQIKTYPDYQTYNTELTNGQICSTAPRAKLLFGGKRLRVKAFRHLKSSKGEFSLMTVYQEAPSSDIEESLWSKLKDNDFFKIIIPSTSRLIGDNLSQLLTVRSLGFKILGVIRTGESRIVEQSILLEAGDQLICLGDSRKCELFKNFSGMELVKELQLLEIESADYIVTEVVVSPRSALIGKNLATVNFRAKYRVQVLALWRQGSVHRGNLAKIVLQAGDALLVQGDQRQIAMMDDDADFLLLYNLPESERSTKAIYAILGLALMVFLTAFNLTSLSVAAFSAVLLILVTGTLKMSEAYREVNWPVIFTTATIIPIGMAFNTTGTAGYLSDLLIQFVGHSSPVVITLVLALASSFISQTLDPVVAVVLVGQLAISLARQLGIDPAPLLMTATLASSFAFLTPFSHRANLMVMGVGGYQTKDYFKVGSRLSLLLLATLVVMIWLIY